MTRILLTTMGTTWQIPPELIGFTNPGLVDLYRFHPFREKIQTTREENGIQPVDELWIVTTTGRVNQDVQKVKDWHSLLVSPLNTSIPGFLGLINEEKTGVGSVHLGLVFCLDVDDPESITPGKELFRFCWATAEELADRKLEYWSQLALRLAG